MISKPVTVRDIAKAAGVSPMTVSRVLRQHSYVAPETRAKVEKVAKELGYRPHPLVSVLMSHRRAVRPIDSHSVLAFVTNFPTRDGWKSRKPYQEFFQGAIECAQRHGYRLEEFWLRENGMTAQRLSNVLFHRNINGLIIAPLPVSQGHMRLDWDKFSAVTFSYTLVWPDLHRAANHQFRSMRLAMRQLRKLGYRRMGLAMPASFDARIDHQWLGSFSVEQHRRIQPRKRVPWLVVNDDEWTEENFRQWYRRYKPDAILSQQPKIVEWLEAMGERVPDDVGFVHLNAPDMSGKFAGIYQNSPLIGKVAVDFLVSMIQRNERGIPEQSNTILVEGTWVEGATVRNLVNIGKK